MAALALCCGSGRLENREPGPLGNVLTYSADARDGYTGEDVVAFSPNTTKAWVTWTGTVVRSGQVRVRVLDARGTIVYAAVAKAGAVPDDQASQAAQAGSWRVLLDYDRADADVRIKVEGATGGAP